MSATDRISTGIRVYGKWRAGGEFPPIGGKAVIEEVWIDGSQVYDPRLPINLKAGDTVELVNGRLEVRSRLDHPDWEVAVGPRGEKVWQLKSAMDGRRFGYRGERFVAYVWFVGWAAISLGFHVHLWNPINIEVHLPFCFIRIGER